MTTAPSSPPDSPDAADSPNTAGHSLVRLVELAFVVPLEVTSRFVDVVPAVVDKVPAAADRVRREVVLARFLGKLAVDQGVRELRTRLTAHDVDPNPDPAADVHDEPVAAPTTVGPDAALLALVDYDHLSSAQIVAKLNGLDEPELRAIEAFELAGRRRRTILGKLEQLLPSS
jgi:hypothetical protein